MLVKLTLPTDTGIPKGVSAHVYYSGTFPYARYDQASVFWKDVEDIAEHEIWAMREAVILPSDVMGQARAAQLPN
ncbi:uncharacterized protein FIBRA_08836 [Fibroporia radiculosa]|uniref:Uncharacterized protein n=1 Tax=Fibroporia radiculosa TaxID=599839 RepID=J4ICK3_9APHY|nr:uncharacterized protein FIBRA_08836 [Fibroporia radiculosa]CCM06561.1 predicted protein [Fibroporia radiculosa]